MANQMNAANRIDVTGKAKKAAMILLLQLIVVFPLVSFLSCTPAAEEEPPDIATCSLDGVIRIAIEHSPECRLQVPGEKVKG